MQEEPKKPSPPKPAPDSAVPAAAAHSKLGFPSSYRVAGTQAPTYAGILVIGIIIGVIVATAWQPSTENPMPAATSTAVVANAAASASIAAAPAPAEPPLVVVDQSAGPSVTISRLNIMRPTWVVVYVSREGRPGTALGARLFSSADKIGKVGLLRDTEQGQTYFVGLSVDNGDRGFSLSKDKPLAGPDGQPLWATFRAL
jgi:hypothetical protein